MHWRRCGVGDGAHDIGAGGGVPLPFIACTGGGQDPKPHFQAQLCLPRAAAPPPSPGPPALFRDTEGLRCCRCCVTSMGWGPLRELCIKSAGLEGFRRFPSRGDRLSYPQLIPSRTLCFGLLPFSLPFSFFKLLLEFRSPPWYIPF